MKESRYPTTPNYPQMVDVVIPYGPEEEHLVKDAVLSIYNQLHVTPIIHVVADNCNIVELPFPESGTILRIYRTTKSIGPYLITNLLYKYFISKYIALQDADDISHKNRLWKQIEVLSEFNMTSCAMLQQAIDGYNGERHLAEPIIFPGRKLTAAPWGRNINSTRMIKKDFFELLNGFGNFPCSGDFHFDNRANVFTDTCHYSNETLAVRRLRPTSLSNGGVFKVGTNERNDISWKVMHDMQELLKHPTLETAKKQGYLQDVISPSHELANCLVPLVIRSSPR